MKCRAPAWGMVLALLGWSIVPSVLAQEIVWKMVMDAGAMAWQEKRYADAEKHFLRALEMAEDTFGPDHLNVAITLNNLAALYHGQAQYAEAESAYDRSLAIREKALGPDHPSVAFALHNLAKLHFDQERYDRAKGLCERALAIRQAALGSEHPHLGQSLYLLAEVYFAQGRLDQAEPLYLEAFPSLLLGTDHARLATALENYAALLSATDRKAEAEQALDQARFVHHVGGLDGSPLMRAGLLGREDVVKKLLAGQADVNGRDSIEGTPLHSARRKTAMPKSWKCSWLREPM